MKLKALPVLFFLFAVGLYGQAIPKTAWVLKFVDSAQPGNPGTAAFDGNNTTFWHTQFTPTSPVPPHEIQIDLGSTYSVVGFSYLPRQDGCSNGYFKNYAFFVSADGVNWGTAVVTSSFTYTGTVACNGSATVQAAKQVSFGAKTGRYVRLQELSEVNGNPWGSAAEVGVFGTAVAPPATLSLKLSVTFGVTPTSPITSLNLSAASATCAAMATDPITVTDQNNNPVTTGLTWSSSDPINAPVSSSGVVGPCGTVAVDEQVTISASHP